uniref:Uncharacterized protein n=1 Tax=Panagrolaimus sp. PS1159 TaxID=55785 RepID=A0AC35GYG8_9BILA
MECYRQEVQSLEAQTAASKTFRGSAIVTSSKIPRKRSQQESGFGKPSDFVAKTSRAEVYEPQPSSTLPAPSTAT